MCDMLVLEIFIVHWCTFGVTSTFEHVDVLCKKYPAISPKRTDTHTQNPLHLR